jgi:hypothetical protein
MGRSGMGLGGDVGMWVGLALGFEFEMLVRASGD